VSERSERALRKTSIRATTKLNINLNSFGTFFARRSESYGTKYSEVPFFYSRLLNMSWKFYGKAEGEKIIVGLNNVIQDEGAEEKKDGGGENNSTSPKTSTNSTWICYYVLDNIIVGVFLENGTPEMSDLLSNVLGTNVLSLKQLKKLTIIEVLSDPTRLEPPQLSLGEFHAELNEDEVREVFASFSFELNVAKTARIGELMTALNADFDEEEVEDAKAGLDQTQCGVVSLQTFLAWWMN